MPATAYRFESCRGHGGVSIGGRTARHGAAIDDVAPVAQLDRALDYGSKGWGFDSSRAHDGTKPASPGEGRDGAVDRAAETVGYRSGQTGQTVNLLAYAFVGSNPTPTTAAVAGTSGRPRVWMDTGQGA